MNTALKIAATCAVLTGWAIAIALMVRTSDSSSEDVTVYASVAAFGFGFTGTCALLYGIWAP